ncbi:Intraflagellar transport protein 81-like protein [Armadillidium nasatum]|uniref:Intraflagellar transport protein 81 homolog n=1 Tax=Armadillidium nasatum TaxID=96803 RepID=A0A5N5SQ49_9CRUS|nr:Intraflagellar transport protein 81-like protein [Armadillidium nasatum]
MSNEIRFIVNELNKAPFNKNYNLITFDSLLPDQLLQILNDVFTEIDPSNKADIREEEPQDTAVRMFGMLRILKYRPPEENAHAFRSGLVAGQKYIIYPILFWLLQRMDDLKKRAYLAKFLVKLDIPAEIQGDADVADMATKNDELMEQFKMMHMEHEELKNSGFSTTELRRDIASMEEERDLVTRRIERMRQKTDGMPNQEAMLESARNLRKEKEKQKEMSQQESDLRSQIQLADQRIGRIEVQLKDIRKASLGTTPEGLIQRLEEEVNVNNYIANEKLPKELTGKKKLVETLKRVADEPAMGQQEIDMINKKVGKLSFYRQNASIIARKKEQTFEKLNDLRNELNHIQEEIMEKREQLNEYSGEEVLRGEEFKLYISKLREKSYNYKLRKAELNELRAEFGVLSRTEEILKAQDSQINEQLSTLETSGGVSGFRDTQESLEQVSSMKAAVDEKKGETLNEMSEMVRELNFKINERKASLAPLLKEVRPLREKMQNLQVEYNDKKMSFNSTSAGLESNTTKLEQDVKSLKDEVLKAETKYHVDSYEKEIMEFKLQQAAEEIKLYLSKDPQEQKKSLREQLMNEIGEQEKQGWMLKEEQKTVKDLVQTSAKQLGMWQDVIKLMEMKKQCLENIQNGGKIMRESGSEALVL